MDYIFDAAEYTITVFAGLAAAATLCALIWKICIRLGCLQGCGLLIGNIATVGLLLIPHSSLLTLILAYAAAGAVPLWIAGRAAIHRNLVADRVRVR